MAVPIELAARRTRASPLLVEPVTDLNVYRSYVFDVSASGTLVYASAASDALPTRLAVVSRAGAATLLPGEPRYFSDPKISPDGRRAAVHIQDGENDVWVVDLVRGTLLRLSTSVGEDETPVWSPDGRFIAWTGTRHDVPRAVYRKPADGSGSEEVLFKGDLHLHLNDWSADGKTLVLQMQDPQTGPDLYTLDVASGKAVALLQTRFREHSARLSPSGRHVVYVSDESGREEVYVQTFPGLGGKLRVTTEGGQQPIWSRDGRSIFFRDQASVFEARFEAGPPSSISTPVMLFPDRFDRPQVGTHTGYDALPDGRFLMSETREPQAGARVLDTQIVFVLNFLQNMSARLAAR
jgi:Tol biopolymer transport system component